MVGHTLNGRCQSEAYCIIESQCWRQPWGRTPKISDLVSYVALIRNNQTGLKDKECQAEIQRSWKTGNEVELIWSPNWSTEDMRDANCTATQIFSIFCWFDSYDFMGYIRYFSMGSSFPNGRLLLKMEYVKVNKTRKSNNKTKLFIGSLRLY